MAMPLAGMAPLPVEPVADDLGNEALWQFAEELGLGEPAADLLARLPEDLQSSVLQGFDPSGTKDGNLWPRLLAYVRSLWSRRLGLSETAGTYLRGLPEEVQIAVISDFDASGSKDGNVSARLIQFAGCLQARNGPSRPPVGAPPFSRPPPPAGLPAPAPVRSGALSQSMAEFAEALGLDPSSTDFLHALPEAIQTAVITEFDPSGTKDGNIWRRLFAFVRRLSAKYTGVGRVQVHHIKALPEEEQKRAILEWTGGHLEPLPSHHRGGSGHYSERHGAPPPPPSQQYHAQAGMDAAAYEAGPASVRSFSQMWGLDGRAECFLHALPDSIRQHVLAGFDGSGTKDGNIWGRLLGFARHIWARSLDLDQQSLAFIKGLPEEAQMICLTDFDPTGTRDGNVAGRLQGFAKKALAQAGQLTRGLN